MKAVARRIQVFISALAVLVSALASGCSSTSSSPENFRLAEEGDPAAEEARRRAMMAMRVMHEGTGEIFEFENRLANVSVLTANACPATCSGTDCEADLCWMRRELCAAQFLQAVLNPTASPPQVDAEEGAFGTSSTGSDSPAGSYLVPEQPTAAKALLARYIYWNYQSVLQKSAEGLAGVDSVNQSTACQNASAAQRKELVGFFMDSYYGGLEASRQEVAAYRAVAESELSSTPSLGLSRERASHWRALAGAQLFKTNRLFDYGLEIPYDASGYMAKGVCGVEEPRGAVQVALKAFREAGVAPSDVLAHAEFLPWSGASQAVSTSSLLDGSPEPPGGSVRVRLAAHWNESLAANVSVLDYFGIKLEDAEAARRYLSHELVAFARSHDAKLGTLSIGEDEVPRYAATATNPAAVDPTYYQAQVAIEPYPHLAVWQALNRPTLGPDAPPRFGSGYSMSLGGFVDLAFTWAHFILGKHDENDPEDDVLGPLGAFLSNDERKGRLTYCFGATSQAERIDLLFMSGYKPQDGLLLVKGEGGLQCATQGHIDQAECDLDADDHIVGRFNTSWFGERGYEPDDAARVPSTLLRESSQLTTTNPVLPTRWYVVAPRPGSASPQPGSYEALIGFVPQAQLAQGTSGQVCTDIPVIPMVLKQAEDILAPSTNWCGNPAVSCSGGRFDERLPLDDELSSATEGVESSWRHYLALARAAADRSDRLGEEYVASGISSLSQQEAEELRRMAREEAVVTELEGLQKICGTSVDPQLILEAISSDGALSKFDQGECPGPAGTKCINGRAIIDWENRADPRLAELLSCMAGFHNTVDYMHLGTGNLCAWTYEGQLCGGGFSGYRCPALPQDGSCPAVPAGTTPQPISAEHGLGFFDTRTAIVPNPDPTLCDQVRVLRKEPGRHPDKLDDLIRSNALGAENLNPTREQLVISAEYGGYVDVKLGGETFFTTGAPAVGPNETDWPCGTSGKAANCQEGDGLFCWHGSCNTFEDRRVVNNRLWSAVIAAQYIAWRQGKRMPENWLPTLFHNGTEPLEPSEIRPFTYSGASIERRVNRQWKAYFGTLEPSHPARMAHHLGWSSGHIDLDGFAIGAWSNPTRDIASVEAAFFGGLSEDGRTPGYFHQYFSGGPRDSLPSAYVDREIELVDGWVVERDCELRHRPRRRTACKNQIRNRVRDSLSDRELRQEDPQNKKLVYSSATGPFRFTSEAVLDGLELLCEASMGLDDRGVGCPQEPPQLRSLRDLDVLGRHLQCLGDRITYRGATAVYENFPAAAMDPLRQESGASVFKGGAGEIANVIGELREDLTSVSSAALAVGREIRGFGNDLVALRAELRRAGLEDQLADVHFEAARANQLTTCIAGAVKAFDPFNFSNGVAGERLAAATTCVNSILQIGFAAKVRDLTKGVTDAQRDKSIAYFNNGFEGRVENLEGHQLALTTGLERVNRALGKLRSLEEEARRVVQKTLWLISREAETTVYFSTALASQQATARARYLEAHENAKRLAFLAKRAIEQRLGVRLGDLLEDLPLVEAPQSWEATLCSTNGVDFERVSGQVAESGRPRPVSFAESFIGSYVTKLESVVESYRLVHGFSEGSDVAVVSLRDQVFDVKAECEIESPNLLYHSGEFSRAGALGDVDEYDPEDVEGEEEDDEDEEDVLEDVNPELGERLLERLSGSRWMVHGCEEANDLDECLRAERLGDAPFLELDPTTRGLRGYRLHFGSETSTEVWLAQQIPLTEGRYRFSWYSNDGSMSQGSQAGRITDLSGTVIPRADRTSMQAIDVEPGGQGEWDRYFYDVVIPETGEYLVGFIGTGVAMQMTIAAPMLERVSVRDDSGGPRFYAQTGPSRIVSGPFCADSRGETFRAQHWERGCVFLCPDGYASSCQVRSRRHCYRETSFGVSQRMLASGTALGKAGVAMGNFNYRIERVAVNFVGTGLRECELDGGNISCHGSGYLPYSLYHRGPYRVVNNWGRSFDAKLFPGRIERARGLAAERYLSTPLSSADTQLIEQYERGEMRGRPFDGTFVVRVWEDDSSQFFNIEDVQLVVGYRYWTRLD